MKKRKRVSRLQVSTPSFQTLERVAMAMKWAELPSQDRDYARNRARALLQFIEHVIPATPSGSQER